MKDVPSPNFTPGRNGHQPNTIVIHIMQGSFLGTDAWFSDRTSKVSAHYGIGKTGEIHRYVQEADQAWHAGVVRNPVRPWPENPNLTTIGIEHEGYDFEVWPDAQKKASAALIKDICSRLNIPIDRQHIIGHYEIDLVDRPYCPSKNRGILDELVSLAAGRTFDPNAPATPQQISTLNDLIRQLIAKLKAQLAKVVTSSKP